MPQSKIKTEEVESTHVYRVRIIHNDFTKSQNKVKSVESTQYSNCVNFKLGVGLLAFDSGTSNFGLGLIFFKEEESWTPTFKIRVRTLMQVTNIGIKHGFPCINIC